MNLITERDGIYLGESNGVYYVGTPDDWTEIGNNREDAEHALNHSSLHVEESIYTQREKDDWYEPLDALHDSQAVCVDGSYTNNFI